MWTMGLQVAAYSMGLAGVDHARGFVDNVDNVDHKLQSAYPYLLINIISIPSKPIPNQ